jgi:ferric-dicitrate binding protein FerR (iron transport regulator)
MDRERCTVALVTPRVLAAVVLALALAGYGRASAQLATVGQAENAVGTLIVKRADGRVEQLRGKGSLPLHEGDECKTERGSQALIRLADGTQLAMNEETTFIVRARTERARGVTRIFKLFIGEMWMKTPGPKSIEVETPVATAAIKGTEFNIQVLPDGRSILTVVEGVVEFGTPFGTCPIRTSTQSFGERGKRCTKPVPINPAPVIAWIANVVR